MLTLHDYFRSGASHRTRIALNLKGLVYQQVSHHLRKGEQRAPAYMAINPQGLVPSLVDGDHIVTQSMAIVEYLDEAYPDGARLLPRDIAGRARVRAMSGVIACDTHPLNNLRVLAYLQDKLGANENQTKAWCHRWFQDSFPALEQMLKSGQTGLYCHGDEPSMVDICLAPQMASAKRFGFDATSFSEVCRVAANAAKLPAFQLAEPERQPDAE